MTKTDQKKVISIVRAVKALERAAFSMEELRQLLNSKNERFDVQMDLEMWEAQISGMAFEIERLLGSKE